MTTSTETYTVQVVTFGRVTSAEILVLDLDKRGRRPTGKRLRIRADAVLDVAMLLIEADRRIRDSST